MNHSGTAIRFPASVNMETVSTLVEELRWFCCLHGFSVVALQLFSVGWRFHLLHTVHFKIVSQCYAKPICTPSLSDVSLMSTVSMFWAQAGYTT